MQTNQPPNNKRPGGKDVVPDGEVVRRGVMLLDGRSMDPIVAEVANELAAEGLSDADIKRAVCARRLGDAAVAGQTQAWIDGCFRALAADPLAGRPAPAPAQRQAADPTPEQERARAQQAVLDAAQGAAAGAHAAYVDSISWTPPRERSSDPTVARQVGQQAYDEYCNWIADGWKH